MDRKKAVDEFVEAIFAEALTSGDFNTVPPGTEQSAPGSVVKKMLTGDWFGASTWPFQQATNSDLAGSTNLQAKHAQAGLGEMVEEIVEAILEDSLAYLSDPDSVGYLINSLEEFGYADEAKFVDSLNERELTEEDAKKLSTMAEDLKTKQAPEFFVTQLTALSNAITSSLQELADDGSSGGAGAGTPMVDNDKDEGNPASVDANVSTVEPSVEK